MSQRVFHGTFGHDGQMSFLQNGVSLWPLEHAYTEVCTMASGKCAHLPTVLRQG